jgi:hypothetical protein
MKDIRLRKPITKEKALFFYLRRFAGIIALVAFQVLVAFVLLEVALRALDPFGISYYPETARYFDTLVLEEPIGYHNRPFLTGTFYGVPVSINSLGMRDREISIKKEGEFRILVMGDSVPFGIGVTYENSLPYQLERILCEQYPQRRFRTLNMGVPSYNTEQELIQLKSIGLKLKPDTVVLLFSDNDIEPKKWVLDKRSKWYINLGQRSYAASLLFVFFREMREHMIVPGPSSAHAGIAGIGSPRVNMGEYKIDSPRWQTVDRSLSEIHTLLRKRNIPFILFANGATPPVLNLLQDVAKREGFPLVNLRRDHDSRWMGKDERLFHNSRFDAHPSPYGNAMLAKLFAENLNRLKVLKER